MRAKLLKEQMGVPAGTEMEVLETGRAWTLRAPSGADIVVPACDVEMVPDTEPFSEPKPVESEGPIDPETDPAVRDEDGNVVMDEPETYDFSQDPEPTEDEEPLEPHYSTAPSDLDESKAAKKKAAKKKAAKKKAADD